MVVERAVGGRTLRARCSPRNARRAGSALSAFERVPVGPGAELRFGWSLLRLSDADDGALVAKEPDFGAWPQRRWRDSLDVTLDVLAAQVRLLARAGTEGEDATYDQVVLAVPGALDHPRPFLRRVAALVPQDSGWLAGTLDDPEALTRAETLDAVAIAALVERRRTLLQALGLPAGFVAIFGGDAVEQVLDGSGRERF